MAELFDVIEELSHNLPSSVNNLPLSLCKPLRPSHKRARTQISADRLAVADMLLPRLPFRILVSDDIKSSRAASWKETIWYAVTRKYIGLDSAEFVNAIVIDADHDDIERWRACGLPPPFTITETPETGRHHITWLLAKPIRRGRGDAKIMRFLSRTRDALNYELDGDAGYSGTLTKNPLHQSWSVHFIGGPPVRLNQLYAPVSLAPSRASRRVLATANDGGEGRNCNLFHRLRHWAYANFLSAPSYGWWAAAVLDQAHCLNLGTCPLDAREVGTVADSIAKWTWHNYHPGATRNIDRGAMRLGTIDIPLPEKQRLSQRRTTTIVVGKSRAAYDAALATLAEEGRQASVPAIARQSGLSDSTVARLRRADLTRQARGPTTRPVTPHFMRQHPCQRVSSGTGDLAPVVREAGDHKPSRGESKKKKGCDYKKCEISDEEIELERSWLYRITAPANDLKPLRFQEHEKRVYLRKADAFK